MGRGSARRMSNPETPPRNQNLLMLLWARHSQKCAVVSDANVGIGSLVTGYPVGQNIQLTASDHFQLGGYRADPPRKASAAVVVIQEIFGVNHHIRSVCDRLAGEGYVAIAPAIFDRLTPNFQSGYSPDE